MRRPNQTKLPIVELIFLGFILVFVLGIIALSSLSNFFTKKTTSSKAAGPAGIYRCKTVYYNNPDCTGSVKRINLDNFCRSTNDSRSTCQNSAKVICEIDPNCSQSNPQDCANNCDAKFDDKCGTKGCQSYEVAFIYTKCSDPKYNYCLGKLDSCSTVGDCGDTGKACTAIGATCDPNAQANNGGCCNGGSCGQVAGAPAGTYKCFAGAQGPCAVNSCDGNKCVIKHVGFKGGTTQCPNSTCNTNIDCGAACPHGDQTQTFSFQGTGYNAGESVSTWVGFADGTAVGTSQLHADSSGKVTDTVTSQTTWKDGTIRLVAQGITSKVVRYKDFTYARRCK